MLLSSNTFNKVKKWISSNRNVANTVQFKLSPSFKRFVLTLSSEERKELLYGNWISDEYELTDNGYKAIVRLAELIG